MLHFLVRLACVRHAASVDSEPGSNSRLKPEICSRRSRSAIPRNRRHECPRSSERRYFVSTLGLEPEPFLLINWHVQPICQRPIRFPPERCAFSPEQITHKCESVCPRNLFKLQRSQYAVNPKESQDFHNFCTVVRGFSALARWALGNKHEILGRATKRDFRGNGPKIRHARDGSIQT